jgi:hypothetical protein
MATHVTQIHVTATDNELYILASTGRGSSELCHIKSGFNAPVNYSFDPNTILPPGNYDLTFVGINWGGPWAFAVTTTPPIAGLSASGTGTVGAVWTKTVQITTT